MLGSLLRTVLWVVLIVAVVAGVGSFFLGYRTADQGEADAVATVGREGGAPTARERGAEIGGRVGAAADRANETMSDASITAKIKSKMALDDLVEARKIGVSTNDKVVTVSGKVATAAERDRAVQLARETDGVKSVTDRIEVVRK
jgi:hyperosmotically inducible protein